MTANHTSKVAVITIGLVVCLTIGATALVRGGFADKPTGRSPFDSSVLGAIDTSKRIDAISRTSTRTLPAPVPVPVPVIDPYRLPEPAVVALLPKARYDSVIGGLLAFQQNTPSAGIAQATNRALPAIAYTLVSDALVYGSIAGDPVALMPAVNFLGDSSVIVPVETVGNWALVLLPSRQRLPSASGGFAPAQSMGWIRRDLLRNPTRLAAHVVIALSARTMTIVTSAENDSHAVFAVGVGTAATPTPSNVTGYLQARYLDPAQNQRTRAVQLTSLHSSVADEPYGGSDGGLIGIHYETTATGAISHGCVRLSAAALAAVSALPLGTLITING